MTFITIYKDVVGSNFFLRKFTLHIPEERKKQLKGSKAGLTG